MAGKKHTDASRRYDRERLHEPQEAFDLVKQLSNRNFDETVEASFRLGVDPRKVVINIEHYGNTTAATIPLALNEAVCSGRLKRGDLVLLASVGAGFTVGAVLLRWGF